MSTTISDAFTHLLTNWKSTASGLLTLTLLASVALLGYPPVMQHPQWVAILGGIQVVAKAWISITSLDAQPPASKPGNL